MRPRWIRPIQESTFHVQEEPLTPLIALPAWDKTVTMDKQKRWILLVKAHVMQDNNPEELRKAQDALMGVKAEMEGVFEFMTVDRNFHDTRAPQVQQGIQALPQKQTVGMRG